MRTLFGIAALALVAAGCGGSSHMSSASCDTPPATTVTAIELRDNQFVPSCAKVAQGVLITFTNNGSMTHTVTDSDHQPPAFDDTLGAGDSSSHTLAAAGTTVHIHCNIHAGMVATIFVE